MTVDQASNPARGTNAMEKMVVSKACIPTNKIIEIAVSTTGLLRNLDRILIGRNWYKIVSTTGAANKTTIIPVFGSKVSLTISVEVLNSPKNILKSMISIAFKPKATAVNSRTILVKE